MKPHIAALIAILGIALAAGLPARSGKAISQGEFAVLFVKFLRIEPQKEWTPKEAVATLAEELGIEPPDGWKPKKPLTEGDLVALVRPAKMPVLSPDPTKTVSRVEARAVLHRIEGLYRDSFVPNRTPGGTPLTGVESGRGNPSAPGGNGSNR